MMATVGGCGTTGIFSPGFSIENTVKILPNPSNGNISIYSVGFNANEHLKISITDLSGKTIYLNNINADESGVFDFALNISEFTVAGLYFVIINGNNTVRRNQFLIINH
jgi:hypothetical protein